MSERRPGLLFGVIEPGAVAGAEQGQRQEDQDLRERAETN